MNQFILVVILAPLICTTLAAEDAPDTEPPHEYYLQIGEKEIPVEVGKPFKLDVPKDQELVLKLRTDRPFREAGIQFRYPQNFKFDFKDKGEVQIWHVYGKDSLVTVFFSREKSLKFFSK